MRIGYERAEGFLAGGLEAWTSEGRPVRSYATGNVKELCEAFHSPSRPQVLDVRQQSEWDEGHIPGSAHLFFGDLPRGLGAVPSSDDVWVACASGHRSAMAASFLERAGRSVRLLAEGGIPDWLSECGREFAREPAEGGAQSNHR